MNYLAHLLLAGENEGLIVGNFIADAYKGSIPTHHPLDIQKGIRIHRFIDSYTDTHPEVLRAKHSLVPFFNHYSGVALDVFFDYHLAIHWPNYHSEDLRSFCDRMYSILHSHRQYMPEQALLFLNHVSATDRLYTYQNIEDIFAVLEQMGKRLKYPTGFEKSKEAFEQNKPVIESAFLNFMPELMDAVEKEKGVVYP